MSRITLGLENLQVETFATADPAEDPCAIGVAGWTDSCEPDRMSRCGPNYCDPAVDLSYDGPC